MPTNENNVLKLCHRKGTRYKQSTEGKKMRFVSNSSRILFFSFFEKSKGSINEKSFQAISSAAQWTFISENNDWAPLPWSFFTHCHKNRSHSYIAPNANSRPEIGNAKEQRTSHTGLKSVEDFSPIITLKLAFFINRERDIHLYL